MSPVGQIEDDGKGHGGPILLAVFGSLFAAIGLFFVHAEALRDERFQRSHLPFKEGAYVQPVDCPAKSWSIHEVIPHSCNDTTNQLPDNRYHLGYARGKRSHWLRVGHDIYGVECDIFGVPGCDVTDKVENVFAY